MRIEDNGECRNYGIALVRHENGKLAIRNLSQYDDLNHAQDSRSVTILAVGKGAGYFLHTVEHIVPQPVVDKWVVGEHYMGEDLA